MVISGPADPAFIAIQSYISCMAGNGSLFTPGGKTPLYSVGSSSAQTYQPKRTLSNLNSFLGLLQGHASQMEGAHARIALEEVTQLEVLTEKIRILPLRISPELANLSLSLEEFLYPRVGLALAAFRAPNPDHRAKIYFEYDHAALAGRFAREVFPES